MEVHDVRDKYFQGFQNKLAWKFGISGSLSPGFNANKRSDTKKIT